MPRRKEYIRKKQKIMRAIRVDAPYRIKNAVQYVLSVLLIGESELPIREFMALNGIVPPTKNDFYAAQRQIATAIHQCVIASINNARLVIPFGDSLSYDASWGSKRQALNCIVEMISSKTHKIVDFRLIHKPRKGETIQNMLTSDDSSLIIFTGSSNMMETEGVRAMSSKWKYDKRIIGVIKDGDVKTHKYFRDSILEDGLEEYFDPNHKKKELRRNFLAFNGEHNGILTDLLEDILNQFGKACYLKKDLAKKLSVWRSVPETLKEKYETIGFLKQIPSESQSKDDKPTEQPVSAEKPIETTPQKKKVSVKKQMKEEKRKASLQRRKTTKKDKPLDENIKKTFTEEEAELALREFLKMNEDLVIKCSKGTTQSNESFHEIKSFFAKKNISWRASWNLRMKLAVLRWNEGFHMIQMLWDALKLPPLPPESQKILEDIWRSRERAKVLREADDYKILRNYVRNLRRKTNPTDPEGHSYASDENSEISTETLQNIYDEEPKLNEIYVDRLPYMPDDEEATLAPTPEESVQLNYCAIPNIGQSCYASSAIQILRTIKFVDAFQEITPRPLLRKNSLFGKIYDLLQKCKNQKSIEPNDIKSLLQTTSGKYKPNEPADVLEFLEDVFQSGHRIIAKLDDSKFNPIYHSYFTVIEQNITCLNCGCSFISSESHPLLRCNISDQTNTLLDCLALSEAKCDLPEYFCPNCKCKTTATIQHTVQKLPKYLIIGLNRQEMDHVNDKVITFETALTYESTTFILKSVVYYYHYTHKSAHYDVRGVLNDSNKLYIFNDNICKRCNQDFPFPRATVFVYERLFSDS